jgi:HlyD family secretion protein
MTPRTRLIWIATLCAMAVAGGVFYQRWTIIPVKAVEVVRRDIVQTVVASGRVETSSRVEMGSQITGVVSQVLVNEGQTVKAGDRLIRIEDSEAAAAVELAKAGIYQAQARLHQIVMTARPAAEQTLAQAEANRVNAQNQFNRVQRLNQDSFASRAQLDEAQRALAVADSLVRSARLQVSANMPDGSETQLAESNLKQAMATFRSAQARLDYTTIEAPSDARIISRQVERGAVVQPGKVLLVLSPFGATQLVVQIDEKNLGLIREGQKARASADAYPGQFFETDVVSIKPAVDAQRGSVEVKLRVIDPPVYLREDMTVSVDIEISRKATALVVPTDSVRGAKGANPHVMRVVDGIASLAPVRTGASGNNLIEIVEGLAERDRVIAASPQVVVSGARVRVTP